MKFKYGQTVMVRGIAPKTFRPGQTGSLCGERNIESEATAKAFIESLGTVLWLVEFSDGQAEEIPQHWLEAK